MKKTNPLIQEKENACGCSEKSQKACGSGVKEEAPKKKPEEQERPTRYGDWVKKGRCIDF